ncbi:MAG: hypothetical protein JSV17_11955 [Candidatus Aminicenantes bacterium]|nr:MAG: hypothetical protein JSV17_11955 [Candidatus Aminicenantes bacterium]
MKKFLAIGLMGLLIFAFCATDILAKQRRSRSYHPPNNFVTFSCFIQPISLGYQHRLTGNVFLTGNMDYVSSESDLLFQAGGAYMLPRKILFFRLYGGGGIEMSRNRGYMYPYVMAGTKFFFLYAEIVHPMQSHSSPNYRFGFSFSF